VWDHAGDRGPLAAFWSAVRELDPAAPGEPDLAGVREGHLASLFTQAGLGRTQVTTLSVRVRHARCGDWWRPFTLGVGPAGAYVGGQRPRLSSRPPPRMAQDPRLCARLRAASPTYGTAPNGGYLRFDLSHASGTSGTHWPSSASQCGSRP
jgi:hypothetical protein